MTDREPGPFTGNRRFSENGEPYDVGDFFSHTDTYTVHWANGSSSARTAKTIEADRVRRAAEQTPPASFERPAHYAQGSPYEAIRIVEHFALNFSMGNALKYLLRAGKKPGESYVKDLKKAVVYLQFEIERAEREEKK